MKKNRNICRCIGILMALAFMVPTCAFASEEEKAAEYPMEGILAGTRNLENTWISTWGVYHFVEDGIELYYSWQDYRYEIKENAIWLPERDDYPLEDYLRDMKITKEEWEGYGAEMVCIIKPLENGEYGAEGYYINEKEGHTINGAKDKIFEGRKIQEEQAPYTADGVDKPAIEVSYYRLMGDPWTYDGKRIKMIGQLGTEGVFEASDSSLQFSFLLDKFVIDELIGTKEIAISELKQSAINYGLEDVGDLESIIVGKQVPAYLEGMFYLYAVDYQTGGLYVDPSYSLYRIDIHPKDMERFEKAKDERFAEGNTIGGRIDGK